MPPKSRHVSQETADFANPREFAAWAFVGLKLPNGDQFVTTPQTCGDWSEQFGRCGFVHISQLHAVADANGMIHISQLPEQTIEYHPPRRGQDHWLNPTGKWVPMGTPREERITGPDPSEHTTAEQADYLEKLANSGKFSPQVIGEMAREGVIRLENVVPAALLSANGASPTAADGPPGSYQSPVDPDDPELAAALTDPQALYSSMPAPVIDTSALDNRPPAPPKTTPARKKKAPAKKAAPRKKK
ncbi:minor tail protein [Gordonia phage ObLaDi]|uniref:Minor tail protein n=2 Tax=Cafassovirus TaxID=3425056 RepID=A0AAE7SF81_9CAUD|nr:hypothetical protein SEA_CAFASSO_21 [Gordonia phage Cafasso]UXE03744.1 minor tail protein [Gordonia phage ObLaDi]